MRIDRIGPRTWAIAVLVGLSVADPGMVTRWGVYVGLAVWITGNPGRFRTDRIFWALVAFLAWIGFSTTWAINPMAGDVFTTAAAMMLLLIFSRLGVPLAAQKESKRPGTRHAVKAGNSI